MNFAGSTMKQFIHNFGNHLTEEDWRCILFQVFYSQIFLCDMLQLEESDSHLNNYCVDILPSGVICEHNLYIKFSDDESIVFGFSSRFLVTRIDFGACRLQRDISSESCRLRKNAVDLKPCRYLSRSSRSSSSSHGLGPIESRANGYLPMKYILQECQSVSLKVRESTKNLIPYVKHFNPPGFFSLFVDLFFPFIEPYVNISSVSSISEDSALHTYCLKNLSLINLMELEHKQIFAPQNMSIDSSQCSLPIQEGIFKNTISLIFLIYFNLNSPY